MQHLFLDKNYDETVELLITARDYLSSKGRMDMKGMTPLGRMIFAQESSRVTARLTQIMSWMLYQKSVVNGEMPEEEALKETMGLLDEALCLEENQESTQYLPPQLRHLLIKSHTLYHRIARIDGMMRDNL